MVADFQRSCLVCISIVFWFIGIFLSVFGFRELAHKRDIFFYKVAGPIMIIFGLIMVVYIHINDKYLSPMSSKGNIEDGTLLNEQKAKPKNQYWKFGKFMNSHGNNQHKKASKV